MIAKAFRSLEFDRFITFFEWANVFTIFFDKWKVTCKLSIYCNFQFVNSSFYKMYLRLILSGKWYARWTLKLWTPFDNRHVLLNGHLNMASTKYNKLWVNMVSLVNWDTAKIIYNWLMVWFAKMFLDCESKDSRRFQQG